MSDRDIALAVIGGTGLYTLADLQDVESHQPVTQYGAANRTDLVDREKAEIGVIRRYLPSLLSESDTAAIVAQTIAELGVTAKKDLGQVMKAVLAAHKGQVDGKLVQKLASERLS